MRAITVIILLVTVSLLVGLVARPFVGRLRRRLHGIPASANSFECGLRVIEGDLPGLSQRWRHGVGVLEGIS